MTRLLAALLSLLVAPLLLVWSAPPAQACSCVEGSVKEYVAWSDAVFVATVVCSDVGGYAAGITLGRHPMAPSVSPKKSWEGFAGSLVACAVGGAVLFATLFGASPLLGAVYGLAVVLTATLGDLGESMVKRDIGVKDMGTLLPGHGGLMDRLDSLLPTAPVAWLLLTAFVAVP